MDPILGQIILWSVPWVPRGWMLCDGSILSIQQNTALFSLLGTTYGGNGQTTFALPDLRTKFPMGAQSVQQVGVQGGSTTANLAGAMGVGSVTIGVNNLPAHNHSAAFTPGPGTAASVAVPVDSEGASTDNAPGPNKVLGVVSAGALAAKVYTTDAPNTTLAPFNIEVPASGGSVAVENTGAGQPLPIQVAMNGSVNTTPPFTTLNFIIAVEGIFPSRP